jgi:hypothetical protein
MCVHFWVGSAVLPIGELGNIFFGNVSSLHLSSLLSRLILTLYSLRLVYKVKPVSSKSSEMTKFGLSVLMFSF